MNASATKARAPKKAPAETPEHDPRQTSFFRRNSGGESVPGARLIAELWAKMNERGESPAILAEHLAITYVYLMKLVRGDSRITALPREQIERAAQYLGVTTSQAFFMAEILRPEDFLRELTLEEKIISIYKLMSEDPLWCGFAPKATDWAKTPRAVRLLTCLLYERAAKTEFFRETEADISSAAKAITGKTK